MHPAGRLKEAAELLLQRPVLEFDALLGAEADFILRMAPPPAAPHMGRIAQLVRQAGRRRAGQVDSLAARQLVLWPSVSCHQSPLDYLGVVTDCVNGLKPRSRAVAFA